MLGLDSRLGFGKHKGVEVWRLIEEDPDYLKWCIENMPGFSLDNEAFTEYQNKIEE